MTPPSILIGIEGVPKHDSLAQCQGPAGRALAREHRPSPALVQGWHRSKGSLRSLIFLRFTAKRNSCSLLDWRPH